MRELDIGIFFETPNGHRTKRLETIQFRQGEEFNQIWETVDKYAVREGVTILGIEFSRNARDYLQDQGYSVRKQYWHDQ